MDQVAAGTARRRPRAIEEQQLLDEAKRVFPAGVIANLVLPPEHMFVPVQGKGSRLIDKSGNEWIDYRCGTGCLILGHLHPAIMDAVRKQLERATAFAQILNEPAIRLAARVVELIPSAEMVRFTNSGGEATFFAMRVARAHTGKDKILKFEGAYHGPGDYMANMIPEGFKGSRVGHATMAGIPQSAKKDYVAAPFNDLETTRALIEENIDELAGVIVEPILGFIPPKPGFLEGLRELTRHYDIPLIFDECVTGFWTALGGAQKYFGVTPDITALGKGFGGGFPIAAVCGRKDIMARFDYVNEPLETVAFCGASLYGHPIGAVASMATIAELEKPGVYERLYKTGADLRKGLVDLLRHYNHLPAQVMGTGPTWHIVFSPHEVVDYRTNMLEDASLKRKFYNGIYEKGIHILGRGYISLAHNHEDVEKTLDACDYSFRKM